MDIKTLRIVYMGTPEFAVASLKQLLEAECHIVAVVTAPDKPAGRGKKIRFSAVKQFALTNDLPLLQPTNLKDPGFIQSLQELKPDLQVVVAFRMLPELVWRIPHQGTFNLHASLLPQYRGAAPINHVIINGETRTGVTTFIIDKQIDTGSILLQDETTIGDKETAGELHDRLMELGALLVLKTVQQLTAGDLKAQSQEKFLTNPEVLKKAPRINREDGRIQWERPGEEVYNLIRGLSPYPGAFTYLLKPGGEKVLCKLFSTSFETAQHQEPPGSIHSNGRKSLRVAVEDGFIAIHSIQQEGKRRMDIADFLAGISLPSFQSRFS